MSEEAIAQFIARDRTWGDLQDTAARLKQSGNPLFIVHLLEHLQSCGRLFERNGGWALDLETAGRAFVPDKLRMLVEDQVDRLGLERRRLLEIAGVVGGTFTAALVAHAARQDVTDVERQFEELCKRSHLLLRREEARLPDGTSSASYAFVHEFYRQVVYERLPAATLTELHHAIGSRLEDGYADRGSEIASELATHFELGHDVERAAGYSATAAENALARNAHREALSGSRRRPSGLDLLVPGLRRCSSIVAFVFTRVATSCGPRLRQPGHRGSNDGVFDATVLSVGAFVGTSRQSGGHGGCDGRRHRASNAGPFGRHSVCGVRTPARWELRDQSCAGLRCSHNRRGLGPSSIHR